MGGLLTFYHLFAFYLVLTSTFKERKYWEIILSAAIAATLFVTLFALISKDPTARGGGTIGNTSFLSSYLIFSLFFSLILFLTKNWVGKIIYGVPMAFIASLLFLPYQEPSRGAIGGFLIGVAILVFTFLLFYTWLQKRQYFKWLIVAFFVLGLIAFFSINQFNIFRQYLDSLEQSTSWQARAIVWDMGWQAWKEKFWLGWGLDNFNIAFTKYYVPALPLSGDIWYDRVHNILLDMPVNAGIFGLLSYLSIFGVAIFGLLKIAPKALQKKNMLLPLGMVSLLVAYLIQDVFVFDMISSYMMFFLSLAFIMQRPVWKYWGYINDYFLFMNSSINDSVFVDIFVLCSLQYNLNFFSISESIVKLTRFLYFNLGSFLVLSNSNKASNASGFSFIIFSDNLTNSLPANIFY